MPPGRYIGDDFRSAVDWAQERLRTTRPIAEDTVWSAIHAKAIVWDNGVYLLEDDDEIERRKKASIRTNQKSNNAAHKWTRLQFRNKNRTGGKLSRSAQRALDEASKPPSRPTLTAERALAAKKPLPPALPFLSEYSEDTRPQPRPHRPLLTEIMLLLAEDRHALP